MIFCPIPSVVFALRLDDDITCQNTDVNYIVKDAISHRNVHRFKVYLFGK